MACSKLERKMVGTWALVEALEVDSMLEHMMAGTLALVVEVEAYSKLVHMQADSLASVALVVGMVVWHTLELLHNILAFEHIVLDMNID